MKRNTPRMFSHFLIFFCLVFTLKSFVFADCAKPVFNPTLGTEGGQCCNGDGDSLTCIGGSCHCDGGGTCTFEGTVTEPEKWVCRNSCGELSSPCCMDNDPARKCANTSLACYNNGSLRLCKTCGVENGPCCVTGNACGVDLEPDGTVGNENCKCKTTIIPNPGTVTGTCSYTDPVTNEVIDGQCVLCSIVNSQWECPCNGSLYDRNLRDVTWNCVENGLTPQQEARCCVAAQPSPVCGAQGREEHCSPLDDCADGDRVADPGVGCSSLEVCCKGFETQRPRPFGLLYTGPVIKNLQDILGPVAKMLYYGGLAIGVFFIILSGYRLMTSEGDPQKTKAAQEQLTSAIIGIIFILLSVTILRVIINQIIIIGEGI